MPYSKEVEGNVSRTITHLLPQRIVRCHHKQRLNNTRVTLPACDVQQRLLHRIEATLWVKYFINYNPRARTKNMQVSCKSCTALREEQKLTNCTAFREFAKRSYGLATSVPSGTGAAEIKLLYNATVKKTL
jgi:hypothetical protein